MQTYTSVKRFKKNAITPVFAPESGLPRSANGFQTCYTPHLLFKERTPVATAPGSDKKKDGVDAAFVNDKKEKPLGSFSR